MCRQIRLKLEKTFCGMSNSRPALQLIINIYIHLIFPNVPSHLLGRRHGHFQLIINIYIHLTFPNVLLDLLGRRHSPLPLIFQFYIHVTFPNVLPALLGRREVNCKDGGEVNDNNERKGIKREGERGKEGCWVLLMI